MLVSLDHEIDLPNQPAAAHYLRNGPKNNHTVMKRRKELASPIWTSFSTSVVKSVLCPRCALCRALSRRQTYLAASLAGLRCFGFGVGPLRRTLRQSGPFDTRAARRQTGLRRRSICLSPLWKLLPACSRFARRACFRVLETGFPSPRSCQRDPRHL